MIIAGTFLYVEAQMQRPAYSGLSAAIAWLDALTSANARSYELGQELIQV